MLRETSPSGVIIPPTDCLVDVGHSVVRGVNGGWYLTQQLQTIEELGVEEDGFKKFIRTGIRQPLLPPERRGEMIGGGVWTAAAMVEIFTQLEAINRSPILVVHSGGRPKYLDEVAMDDPTVTEGRELGKAFTSRYEGQTGRVVPARQIILETSRNTEDDLVSCLDVARENGCVDVTFVLMRDRIKRARVLFDGIRERTQRYDEMIVNFFPAEVGVAALAERKDRTMQWQAVEADFIISEGRQRTIEMEEGGIKASHAGTYGQALGGVGKT